MNRRTFLHTALMAGGALSLGGNALAQNDKASLTPPRKLVLGAPLTHSDWMLKPGIAWGEEGVHHITAFYRPAAAHTCRRCQQQYFAHPALNPFHACRHHSGY